MAIDYPYTGPKSFTPVSFLPAIPALRSALFDAAAACLLAIDYLASTGRVHPDSLFVVGCSFGAFFGPIAVAIRSEADGLVIIQGGGDLQPLLEANMDYAGIQSFEKPLSVLGTVILHPFEPTRWVGSISPRPVTLINSRGDERMPTACVEALYEAAWEPKRMIWIESRHLHPTNARLIARLTREVERVLFGTTGDGS
jgi:hypothetical protein